MNILFVCTSNQDRSPALEKYFRIRLPHNEYRSAGINKYFTEKKGTHYLTEEDIEWADLIVFAEKIHLQIAQQKFKPFSPNQAFLILELGDYTKGNINNAYLIGAWKIVNPYL